MRKAILLATVFIIFLPNVVLAGGGRTFGFSYDEKPYTVEQIRIQTDGGYWEFPLPTGTFETEQFKCWRIGPKTVTCEEMYPEAVLNVDVVLVQSLRLNVNTSKTYKVKRIDR